MQVTLPEISRSPLSIVVAGLQYTVCNATRKELLTKFLKVVLKLAENFQEVVSKMFLITDIQTYKLQLSVLGAFKVSEITSTVKFLSSEAGANELSKK